MKTKNKRSKIIFYLINFLIVLLVSGLTIYKMIKENGIETFQHLRELSFFSIIILTIMFFLNYYLEGIVIAVSMREYKNNFKPQNGFVVQAVGGLFSAITPLKIGYYPSLGYAYSKFKVKPEEVLKSMAKTSFCYQILLLVICIISLFVCLKNQMIINIDETSLNLKYVALIGLAYNLVLFFVYFIIILSPSLHKFLITLLIWFMSKIKKIENKEEFFQTKIHKMEVTREEIKKFFKNFKESSFIFLIYLIKLIFFGSLPYVAYLIMSKQAFQADLWLYSIILGHLISYITNIIPIPGASGAAEITFIAVFSLIFSPASLLTSVMLIWRMFSYFMNIIVGFITFIIMINVKRKSPTIQ